jgi:hypothetical protein
MEKRDLAVTLARGRIAFGVVSLLVPGLARKILLPTHDGNGIHDLGHSAFLPSNRPGRLNLLGIGHSTRSASWSLVEPQDAIAQRRDLGDLDHYHGLFIADPAHTQTAPL